MERRRVVHALVLVGGLALFAWRELGAMRADGATMDEAAHLAYGERGLTRGTFVRDGQMLNSKMPVSVLNALPVAAAARWGRPPDERTRLWLGRLATVALGLALGWLVFRWARELFGFRGGALALFLYTFCPNVLAHSHLVTTDVATALGMFGAIYAFWRYRQAPGAGRLTVAAAAFGAAQLTKATALFLVPIFALIVLVEALRQRQPRVRAGLPGGATAPAPGAAEDVAGSREPAAGRPDQVDASADPSGAGAAAVDKPGQVGATADQHAPVAAATHRLRAALVPAAALAVGAALALNLGFAGEQTLTPLSRYAPVSRPFQALAATPGLKDVPLPLPLPYVAGLDMVAHDARGGSLSYLHGRFSTHGFWDYYLLGALVKVPLGTLAVLVVGAWLAATGRVRAPAAEAYLLVPVAFLLAYLSFALELQIGMRYFLPALPFLFVFAARAGAWRPPSWTAAIVVGLCVAWTAASSLSVHPRYIPYFNEIAGGPANGWHWLVDSDLDWGQDTRYMREVYARRSPIKVWLEPDGPLTGRIAVRLTNLVLRYPWLRDHFRPVELVHDSWAVFDLGEDDVERCCPDVPRSWTVPDPAGDLAPAGRPIGGGDGGVGVNFLERLNDGLLGANSEWDAARSTPSTAPVRAWFGIAWDRQQEIGRVVAYPAFLSRGPASRRFLATDYVLQWWDGRRWLDLPGTRVTGNRRLHVEHGFPPVRTTGLRLLVERELNEHGTEATPGVFRAACLELVIYPP